MAYRDLLLTALTYPDATPDRALRSGIALARRLGGDLTLLIAKADIPALHNPVANALLGLDRLGEIEEARSAATAQLEASCARICAEIAGVEIHAETVSARLYEEADVLCRAARTRDLTLAPIGPAVLADRSLAETILFGSGRPILIYPEAAEIQPGPRFERVAIAWDGSATAARAVADALPLLQTAGEVRVFTALGDKPQATGEIGRELQRHLRTHGVEARLDELSADAEPIGRRLAGYVAAAGCDLLVMGGFGHARLREFVLGGATDAMLAAPPCPVLLSH